MRKRLGLLVSILTAVGLFIGVVWAAENRNTSGRWAFTSTSATIPDGGNSVVVTDLTLGSTGVTTITLGGTATTTANVGGAATTTVNLGSAATTAVTITGAPALTSDSTISKSESAATGAPNKFLQTTLATGFALFNQYVGIPKLGVTHIATLSNGGTSVAIAAPLTGACNAIANGAEANDTTNFVTASSSYKYTWAADVATNDGIDCVIAYPAVTDPISFGFWFRTDTAISSGDIDINFDDGGVTDGTFSTFATTTLDEWHWIELDITTACSGECASVDGIEFLATAQGAGAGVLDDIVMNIDQLAMWKAADEVAIGNIYVGGLIDLAYAPKAQDGVNTVVKGVEWTSHFVNYQTGADAIISVTDLSAQYGTTLEALQ